MRRRSRTGQTVITIALLVLAPIMAIAEPSVGIHTDSEVYSEGDAIEVSISASNSSDGMSVDVYVGLLTPDGGLYTFGPAGWTSSLDAWITDIFVPTDFKLTPTPFWWFNVPSSTPPIGQRGYYNFASVLTFPGTFDWVSELSLAPFEVLGEGEVPVAYIDSITPNPVSEASDVVAFVGHGVSTLGTIEAYDWTSDLDGQLSSSASFDMAASALSPGTHTISFSVKDNLGAWSVPDTETLEVQLVNYPPIATISAILPNPAMQGIDKIVFSGISDDADGTVAAHEWRSETDGVFGDEPFFNLDARELSPGEHTIYYRVQDDDGLWSEPDSQMLVIEGASFVYVDGETGDDANDGSKAAPFKTITQALDVSVGKETDPVVILASSCTYSASTNGEAFPLNMKSWVSLVGEDGADATTLDAESDAKHVIVCESVSFLTIQGFTITGGNGRGVAGPDDNGAGIFCADSDPTIQRNVITGNVAGSDSGHGGGIYCEGGSPAVQHNTISINVAFRGGGIYAKWDCEPTVHNNIIIQNVAHCGGGIYSQDLSSLTWNSINMNVADLGGGVYFGGGATVMSTNVFSGNGASDRGGGMFCCNASPVIATCTFSQNAAETGGGAICGSGTASPDITNTTFSGNETNGSGGAVHFTGGVPVVMDSTFIGNSADESGGAVYCDDSWAKFASNEITQNVAVFLGGGVYCVGGEPTVQDNIISENEATDGFGGGVGLSDSSAVVEGNTLEANTALWGGGLSCTDGDARVLENQIAENSAGTGGGVYLEGGETELAANSIAENDADSGGGVHCTQCDDAVIGHNFVLGNVAHVGDGGGIQCQQSLLTIANNLILENAASVNGGGIRCLDGSLPEIYNCTIVDNAADSGGGISADGVSAPTITDCILWGNEDDLQGCSVTFCCVQDTAAGLGNVNSDPLFAKGYFGDYYLHSKSPCVDTGSRHAEKAGLWERTTQVDDAPDTGTVDMGFHYPIP